jgi:hypothetical protein
VHELLQDAWIAARVDEAVRPYVGRLPAGELAWMREQLAEILASEPEAADLVRRAHPRVADTSGEVPQGALPSASASPAAKPIRRIR